MEQSDLLLHGGISYDYKIDGSNHKNENEKNNDAHSNDSLLNTEEEHSLGNGLDLGDRLDLGTDIQINNESELKTNSEKDKGQTILNWVHGVLDVGGFIPAFGAIPDLLNGFIYLCEKDWGNMGLSFVAAVPLLGDGVAAVSKTIKYSKSVKSISNTLNSNKEVKQVYFFWTKNSKFNAIELKNKLQTIHPNIKFHMLEKTNNGIIMEKKVNRKLVELAKKSNMESNEIFRGLRSGTLFNDVFKFNKKGKPTRFKKEFGDIETYQKRRSKKYAEQVANLENTLIFLVKGKGEIREGSIFKQIEEPALKKKGKKVEAVIEVDSYKNRREWLDSLHHKNNNVAAGMIRSSRYSNQEAK